MLNEYSVRNSLLFRCKFVKGDFCTGLLHRILPKNDWIPPFAG